MMAQMMVRKSYLKKKKINYIKNLTNIGYEKSLIKGFNYLKKKKN